MVYDIFDDALESAVKMWTDISVPKETKDVDDILLSPQRARLNPRIYGCSVRVTQIGTAYQAKFSTQTHLALFRKSSTNSGRNKNRCTTQSHNHQTVHSV